jgi:dienelactone hydrolase
VLGGYIENRLGFWSTVEAMWEHENRVPLEQFNSVGDPGLLRRVSIQRPQLERPDLTNVHAFKLWQSSLRDLLDRDLFRWSEVPGPRAVSYRKISAKVVEGGIKRTFLAYKSYDGTEIPAYLLEPPHSQPLPAIIVLHGHVKANEQGISQTAGLVQSYHNRVGLELAQAGYITLTIEFRGFGYLGAQIGAEHNFVAYNALLSGSFYKAVLSKDIKFAVDLLRSIKGVDTDRIGITGVSFGGEMAVTYAALDTRIKTVIFQEFGGFVGQPSGKSGNNSDELHLCHLIPNEGRYLRQEDLFLLIAPRPLLGIKSVQEGGWSAEFKQTINQAYSGLGAASHFQLDVLSGGHEYFVAPAINFVRKHL